MAILKAKDLRSLSIDELDEKFQNFKKELFQLRMDAKLGKLENMMKLKHVRRDLAKVLTVKKEMELKKNG